MLEIDARGLACPMPLLKAKKGLNSIDSGERVKVRSTDAGSWRDFAAFTEQSGHRLISAFDEGGEFTYVIEKK
ncbi:TusA-related sulfurtransferase [Sinobacterium caligoides]|uniref:TusA-related sulfurtransferase n=1 Tax=Sinobacterium caligoides TaxID=933926 RepID=A0A3N2E046_9GAMM|nr:sulfurtransferase TusA family protein [Sinobacterium caligoides]ROS05454.1 TusA-related sulfurtransferase [Sinobacterium caligoides]